MSEKQPGQDDFARSQGYPGVLLASHPLKAEKWEMCKDSERKMKGFARVWVQQQQSYWALYFPCGAMLTVSFLVGRKGV